MGFKTSIDSITSGAIDTAGLFVGDFQNLILLMVGVGLFIVIVGALAAIFWKH